MHKKVLLLCTVVLTMCAGGSATFYPHVVKRFHLYNQTGGNGPLTVYTPKHGGMFRANVFIVITVGNGKNDSFFCGLVGSTTRFGLTDGTPLNSCPPTTSPGRSGEGTMPIADVGGQPLTFLLYTVGDVSGAKCDVTVIVEEL